LKDQVAVIGLVCSQKCILLFVDLADFNEELHRRALSNPVDCLPAFEDAFEGVVRDQENASKVRFSSIDLLREHQRRVWG
jgi:DNA replicative helicase MCM subunit Mcm2 (Cdc46/Mcm family)